MMLIFATKKNYNFKNLFIAPGTSCPSAERNPPFSVDGLAEPNNVIHQIKVNPVMIDLIMSNFSSIS